MQAALLANAAGWPLRRPPPESQEDGFQTDKLLQVTEKALTVLERVTRASTAGGLRVQLAGVKASFQHVCSVAA